MNEQQYKDAVQEVFDIEAKLITPTRRKDTRLILRHMELCSQIRAYDLARQGRGRVLEGVFN